MFKIGDKVVYPMHGAGVIESIEKRDFLGDEREYYIVKMPIGDMMLMVPVENAQEVGLRSILDAEDIDAVLQDIDSLECDMTQNWSKRYRDNMDLLKTGDITQVVRVLKGLVLREREKSLSTGEHKMLMSARNILISEIVLACGKTKAEVERRLDDMLSV